MTLRPTISVIIPTLNEQDNLRYVLPRIPKVVDEVILVDGHSTDRTIEVARELYPDVRVVMQSGKGKGAALRSGFAAATGDIIVMLDADGSTDPGEIPMFVHALLGGADFAKGSRFVHGGGTSDMPFHRRMGNKTFVRMVRRLYGGQYTDLCYGYNAFWRRVLPVLDLDGDGFEIETMMNIRALRAGLRIVEVPSFEDRRIIGVGNLRTIPDGWRVLRTIWRERARAVIEAASSLATTPAESQLAVLIAPADGSMTAANGNGHGNGNGNGNGHGNGHFPISEADFPISEADFVQVDGVAVEVGGVAVEVGGIAEDSAVPTYRAIAIQESRRPAESETWQRLADEYIVRLRDLIEGTDRRAIARVVEELRRARDRGATIFVAGNDGSSVTAAHWVNDLGKANDASGHPPLRLMNLSDNLSWFTALGGPQATASERRMEHFARPADVLIVISASGDSPKILRVLEAARGFGMRTIGLIGYDGGAALPLLDVALWVKTEPGAHGLVKAAHTALADIVTTCLSHDRVPAATPSR